MAVHVGLQYCGHKKYFGNNGSRGVTLLHAILFNGIRMYITTACLCSRSNRVRIGMESCLLEGNAMNARSNYVTLRRGTHCGGGGDVIGLPPYTLKVTQFQHSIIILFSIIQQFIRYMNHP